MIGETELTDLLQQIVIIWSSSSSIRVEDEGARFEQYV